MIDLDEILGPIEEESGVKAKLKIKEKEENVDN